MKTDNSFDKLKQIHQFISTKPTQTNAISSRRLERLSKKLNGKLQERLTELEEENKKMHEHLNKQVENARKSGM